MQPDKVRAIQRGKAPGYDGAVLAGHLHHVGHGAHRRQRAVPGEQSLLPVGAAQRQHQLQRHAAPGQMLEGIFAVAAPWIHHRAGHRQRLLALVVIRHHHIHADGAGKGHLLHAGDAAVHRHQQRGAALPQPLDGVAAQAVAVLDPAGNVVQHVGAPAFQIVHHDTRGGDAVHVIVSKNRDPLSGGDSLCDPFHGLVHIPHQKWGIGQRRFLCQEFRRVLGAFHAAARQHAGYQVGIARVGQPFRCGAVFLRHMPGRKFHGSPASFRFLL